MLNLTQQKEQKIALIPYKYEKGDIHLNLFFQSGTRCRAFCDGREKCESLHDNKQPRMFIRYILIMIKLLKYNIITCKK